MTQRYEEGENFTIDLEDSLAYCRVWSRPDIDSATGARFAQRKITVFRRLAREEPTGLVFDLSRAPAVTGPVTQEALAAMLAPWERLCKPVGIVLGPSPMQALQMGRLIRDACLTLCAVFPTEHQAVQWAKSNHPAEARTASA